jgi:mRNA interferase MazF
MTRGDVWMADLDPPRGSEQAGIHPVVIVQTELLNSNLPTVIVVPFTSTLRWRNQTHCVLVSAGNGGLRQDSLALCNQIRVCDKTRLFRLLGQLSDAAVLDIERGIAAALRR